ncbi:tetratricopeptide repeat protein [Aeromonas media]|uniref:tetratricopeptide repeat protein n=1 Tax=Aeromonas media TaxID=651 RepID=UPI0022815A00|nr:DUF2971 domain-containing protein [Aeromonas media]MCY9835233.1 hypothetical protein [Aeromonas media]
MNEERTITQFEFTKQNAEAGDSDAMFNLSVMYGELGGDSNLTQARVWCERAASAGQINAMFNLGVLYQDLGGGSNLEQARIWYEKAANAGYNKAMFNLGKLYHTLGGDSNLAQARVWYERANLKSAKFNLGLLYQQLGGDSNFAKARIWYEQAAKDNHTNAMLNLGVMHEYGLGGDINLTEAHAWFEQAVKAGSSNAMFALGLMYDERGRGTEPELAQARIWYEKAVNAGHIDAMVNLGLMYQEGRGGDRSISKALAYYTKVANNGHATANFNLGLIYLNGRGVEVDHAKAREFFEKSATKDSAAWIILTSLDYIVNRNSYVSRKVDAAVDEEHTQVNKHSLEWEMWIGDENHPQLPLPKVPSWIDSFLRTNMQKDKAICNNDEVWNLLAIITLLAQWQQSQHLVYKATTIHHFTRFEVLHELLPLSQKNTSDSKKNIIRCYHSSYMNDPSEGQRLIKFHNQPSAKNTPPHNAAIDASKLLNKWFNDSSLGGYFSQFDNAPTVANLPASVFTASFTERSDSLDLWRAYGSDGKGVSISIPIKGTRTPYLSLKTIMKDKDELLEVNPMDVLHACFNEKAEPRYYRVEYTDESIINALAIFAAPLKRLDNILSDNTLSETTRYQWNKLASKHITEALLCILYLFKDEEYVSEKEVRAIQIHHLDDPQILRDKRSPSHLFCELPGCSLFTKPNTQIIIGPKAENVNAMIWDIRHLLTLHRYDKNVIVKRSIVQYR